MPRDQDQARNKKRNGNRLKMAPKQPVTVCIDVSNESTHSRAHGASRRGTLKTRSEPAGERAYTCTAIGCAAASSNLTAFLAGSLTDSSLDVTPIPSKLPPDRDGKKRLSRSLPGNADSANVGVGGAVDDAAEEADTAVSRVVSEPDLVEAVDFLSADRVGGGGRGFMRERLREGECA